MLSAERFTDGRVPASGLAELFGLPARWQSWLDVEVALAGAQAELGIVPNESADAIAVAGRIERLDLDRVAAGIARTSHPLMPLILELSRVAGEPHGGWVHWGATSQNITQTGDVLILKRAHQRILTQLARVLLSVADLTERGADMVMAGRTHGQHAVPITFGLKTAAWLDELSRHATRLQQLEPRLFVSLLGGAAGSYASLGERAEELHALVAQRLGLAPMPVPARNIGDHVAEFGCVLGLLAATSGRIAREVYTLMKTEFGEAEEPVPAGTVGSSTMPQKRNPQLCQDVIGIAAEVRASVPLMLECLQVEHEADNTPSVLFDAVAKACILIGDILERINLITTGMTLHPDRMRYNLDATGGLITAEAVMLQLGAHIGRQTAHEVVYAAAQTAATTGGTFSDTLHADPIVTRHLSPSAIRRLLEPENHTGLSAHIAHTTAKRARAYADTINVAVRLRDTEGSDPAHRETAR